MIYELLILDAEDSREFAYFAERLFFSSPELAEAFYRERFNNRHLFWKVKGYPVDQDGEAVTVAGNWTRENLTRYYNENSKP